MTKLNYILKTIIHFRKQHLAVILGTILSTAVITAGLMVGDSVRFSLSQIVDSRLGKIEFVVQTNERFVRSDLAKEISAELHIHSAALLMLDGASINPQNESRINNTQIIGFDSDFNNMFDKKMPELYDDEAFISSNLADRLKLKSGDDIILKLEKLSVIPINSPYGKGGESAGISLRLKVRAVAENGSFDKFSLKNSQITPYNVFVSRKLLESELEISSLANVLVFSQNEEKNLDENKLNQAIEKNWKLKDAGLELKYGDGKNDVEILSKRIFIDKAISNSLQKADFQSKYILSYLVNSIQNKDRSTPYSFVSALSDNFYGKKIHSGEIVLNDWSADDLKAKIGDSLQLKYFVINGSLDLSEDSSMFRVTDIISTKNTLIDRSLMPNFPGFTQAISCMEWNTNAPIDMKKIRDKDEKYWADFRGTPKAIIGIDDGIRIWKNPFGDFTSIRFTDTIHDKNAIDSLVLSRLNPKDVSISAQEIKAKSHTAAQTGVDFGELFLSLSFFVLMAAVFLTVLLFKLNLNSRKAESGLFIALGFSRKQILKLRFQENIFPVFIASFFGIIAGIFFNQLMLRAMNSVWIDMVRTSMMQTKIVPTTLVIGGLSGFLLSLLSIYFVLLKHTKNTAIGLINNTIDSYSAISFKSKKIYSVLSVFFTAVSLSLLLFLLIFQTDPNPLLFLLSATIFLAGSFFFVLAFFTKSEKQTSNSFTVSSLIRKNLLRNRLRSFSVILLLALGVFVVMITAANRKTFSGSENRKNSGTGGYALWMESSVPLTENLNNPASREKLGFEEIELLKQAQFVQLMSKKGDDASCLNLNHIEMPEILGVDATVFDQRNSFSFEKLSKNIKSEHPWLELEKVYDSLTIPAFADQTVISWGLLKKIGDTLNYTSENGKQLRLVLVGGLNSSVFQGKILISTKNFRSFFPSVSGSKTCLIDTKKPNELRKILAHQLQDYGIDIQKTGERLERFNSVTNIYLQVFMLLGALGMLIATIGIGILLYRNLLDSQKEIAMMLALGFSKSQIFKLIFRENLVLVLLGMGIGLTSALIGILPSLISVRFDLQAAFIALLVVLIFANALFWVWVPVKMVMKGKVLDGLRENN